jgi:hypothetical protein
MIVRYAVLVSTKTKLHRLFVMVALLENIMQTTILLWEISIIQLFVSSAHQGNIKIRLDKTLASLVFWGNMERLEHWPLTITKKLTVKYAARVNIKTRCPKRIVKTVRWGERMSLMAQWHKTMMPW